MQRGNMTQAVTLEVRRIASDFLQDVETLLQRVDVAAIEALVELLRMARERGATIYIAGNGGSASTASHLVNDLGKATKANGRRPMRVVGLSDNLAWITALGNDEGFERIFSGQLENYAEPGDVLIVISAAGNSPNLVRAVELARARGLTTVALLGFDGGVLKHAVDVPVWVTSAKGAYGAVESVHLVLCHALVTCLNHADEMAALGVTAKQ